MIPRATVGDMGGWLFAAYLALSVLAIVQTALIAAQTWEHKRFARSRLRRASYPREAGRVAMVVPCKGLDIGVENNLRSLFRLDYGDYEIRFVVESADDPVYRVIERLIARHPEVDARVIVAGPARESGQKVHNLRAATADLTEEIEYLAFVDSDARLRRPWLRALVSRLDRPGVGAATGYRWFIPSRPSLTNCLLYSINASVAIFLGAHPPTVVWGGSWAMRRDRFEALGIRDAWQGTLSDDLVASRLLRRKRLRVAYEPACMVASPLDATPADLLWFVRRQYVIVRSYFPFWWAMMVLLLSYSNLVFFGSLAAIATGLITRAFPVWLPASVCGVLYSLGALGGWLRQELALVYFPRFRDKLRQARWFEILGGPPASLVNWLALGASMIGRQITWRGIVYRLGHDGHVLAMGRQGEPAAMILQRGEQFLRIDEGVSTPPAGRFGLRRFIAAFLGRRREGPVSHHRPHLPAPAKAAMNRRTP